MQMDGHPWVPSLRRDLAPAVQLKLLRAPHARSTRITNDMIMHIYPHSYGKETGQSYDRSLMSDPELCSRLELQNIANVDDAGAMLTILQNMGWPT